jgi:GntR family transcriptional regulator/MocR family aminotransferase
MAAWRFGLDSSIDLPKLARKALKKDLFIADTTAQPSLNAIRLGFASSTETELEHSVEVLVNLLK